jgi:hypothetical protein
MNPEFRRYVWLELTTQRLVVMPIVVGALLWLVYLVNGARVDDDVASAALWFYGALALLWGTRVAAESVVSEIAARTWDGQRMSSLGPWSMAWAKLVGSTVYVWYGCALLGGAFLVASFAAGASAAHALARLGLFTCAALIAHASSLLVSLHLVRKRTGETPARGAGLFSLGLLAAAPFLMIGNGAAQSGETVWWYASERDAFALALASSAVFAAWAVIGLHMLMRLELQRRNPPWVWLAFVVFVGAWVVGFVEGGPIRLGGVSTQRWDVGATRLLVTLVTTVGLYYVTLLVEPKDPVELRRLVREVGAGRLGRAAEAVPRWLVTFLVAAVLGVALAWTAVGLGAGTLRGVVGFVGAALGFMVRDAALLVALNLSPRPRRADAAGFLYLVVLYALAPAILSALDLGRLHGLFLPRWDAGVAGALPALAQAVVLAGLAAARWRAYRRRTGGAPLRPGVV